MPLIAWALMTVLSIVWGSTFLFNRIVVVEVPPITVVFFRIAIGAAILLAVAVVLRIRIPHDRRAAIDFLVMGLLNNAIPFVLIVWGQKTVGTGLASILNATTPIFGVIIAHLFTTDDKATPNRVAGVLLGIVGVAVMMGVDALAGLGDHIAGELACLSACLCYGFAALWSRRFRGRPPIATAAGQLTASAVILLPAMLLVDRPWTLPVPSSAAVASILMLAVTSTAIAYVIFFRVLTIAGATNVMLVTLMIPPSAILMGALVLGERLALQHLVGVVLITAGLVAIDGRLARALRRRLRGTDAPERARGT